MTERHHEELQAIEIDLEHEMLGLGVTRYRNKLAKAREYGSESRTPVVRDMVKRAIEPMVEAIKDYVEKSFRKGKGRRARAAMLLRDMDPDVVAFITIKSVLDTLTFATPLHRTALLVGKALEMEQRLEAWEQYSKANQADLPRSRYEVTRERAQRGPSDHYKQRVLTYTMNQDGFRWDSWSKNQKVGLGVALIEMLATSTGWIRIAMEQIAVGKPKKAYMVRATQEVKHWLEKAHASCELLCPSYLPMVVPPRKWETPTHGGYLSDALRPLTLVKNPKRAYLNELRHVEMPTVYSTLNALQETPWKVNTEVLEIMQEFWDAGGQVKGLPTREGDPLPPKPVDIAENHEARKVWRKAASEVYFANRQTESRRLQGMKTLWVAHKYAKYDAIYFPYQLDFRGRLYCVPQYLQPQTSDYSKSLLVFADGEPIETEEQAKWLAIHGANLYGDDAAKDSLERRVDWASDHAEQIHAVASDPFANRWWLDADKPWQFLAWCLEWAQFQLEGFGFISRIPVALDGSCNGLQHYSAMLRDPVGGRATNLVPSSKPADIYQEVADLVTAALEDLLSTSRDSQEVSDEDRVMARQWLDFGITRKTTKRSVMTLPYGSTLRACQTFVHDEIMEQTELGQKVPWERPWPAAVWLARHVWASIGDVVVAAREAMDWLKGAARTVAKENLPITWTAPSGFPVLQAYPNIRERRIELRLGDKLIKLKTYTENRKQYDKHKQANGIAPNFVHSLDAAALMLCVTECLPQGLHSFAMVHDSYATTAARTPVLARTLRKTFVEMYESSDVLEDLRQSLLGVLFDGDLPPVPDKGNLNIHEVLQSEFFFA